MRKPIIPPLSDGEPPARLLKAWTDVEVALGEPLSREEMAQVAMMYITAMYSKAITCGSDAGMASRVAVTRSLLKSAYESGAVDFIEEYVE